MGAAKISNLVKEEFDGVGPSKRTIQNYYKDGRVGTSPLKRSAKGDISDHIFKTLVTALDSFVTVGKLNGMGGENTYAKLSARVNRAFGKEVKKMCFKLLNIILQETVVELNAGRINDVEKRRVLCT